MNALLFHGRRLLLSHAIERLMRFKAWQLQRGEEPESAATEPATSMPQNPTCPADFHPLENACFQHPYAFYQMLRDQQPVYQLPNGIYCISRYDDIMRASRDTDTFASANQGAVASLEPGQSIARRAAQMEKIAALGLIPANVLATADPPTHTAERKVGHSGLNSRLVKSLEPEVDKLCREMMDRFIPRGQVEFMQEFGWRLPMVLIIRLLGLPEQDFQTIKRWCVHGVNSQSGVASPGELLHSQSANLTFIRYCWRHYLKAKKNPGDNLLGKIVRAAADPDLDFDDDRAVSAIFQLLIAGSDSSATSMGNALKLLVENPALQREILQDMDNKLPAFVEEVFRLESAFQGHFRWTRQAAVVAGTTIPADSRVFLMWASGNRDERFWDNPDTIQLSRKNGKKHFTFGHGIHACIGRELARMEIRIVLREFLLRTENLRIDGDTPFVASMFARTLLRLPVRFEPKAGQHRCGNTLAQAT